VLITAEMPSEWGELEDLVVAILNEAGLEAKRNVRINLPRGSVDVDVLAEETHDGIVQRIVCECKDWANNIPKAVVHAFRTVVQECGAHRGYVISRVGFQSGAIEAAQSTNIQLVTFKQFQEIYFEKWYEKRLWAIEQSIKGFHTYYEMVFGKPGYSLLASDEERAAYDVVWKKYQFAGVLLTAYSPFSKILGRRLSIPPLPLDPIRIVELEEHGVVFPQDIIEASAYRGFFTLLEGYSIKGLSELRRVNPRTHVDPDDDGSEIREIREDKGTR
jgi:hypothetical protein